MTLSAVAAEQTYFDPGRPMGYGNSRADIRLRTTLNLSDVVGKRLIQNGFGPAVTVREENAATALEVMSRYAVDPRWIRYLPPTMSPVGAGRPDLLEDPQAAFDAYAKRGVTQVVCEEKHMGSRAIVVLARDEAAARENFGVTRGTGALYTRTGRSFFDPVTTERFLGRMRTACAPLFDELDSDWLMFDAELLPWNIKGKNLIRDQFASVTAAAEPELHAFAMELALAADRGLDVSALTDSTARRRTDVRAYTDAYLRYVDVDAGPDTAVLAPFELLASAGTEYGDRAHSWHLDIAARLASADPHLFRQTRHILVDTGSVESRHAGAQWWETLTGAEGGEGMVVKPAANLTRVDGKLVDPGVKVRGREYLRMIYGPEYLANLDALRSRDLRHKRSMSMREYQLGREALARQSRAEPLWRIHECVFAVLALESEPVDPRL
jgi:polynucleotide kinase-phosphatase